jgi:aspartate 1-decarboxylase
MIKLLKAKFHGIYVTDANLQYSGSITLDPIYCEKANIYPLEFVEIWNKTNGARFSTYVIYGEAGSKSCILNGSAARQCLPNDQLIIAAFYFGDAKALLNSSPKILTFNLDNSLKEISEYNISKPKNEWYQLSIAKKE